MNEKNKQTKPSGEAGKPKRIAGLDLARALAIVFMIFSHTQLYLRGDLYANPETGEYATLLDQLVDGFLASDMAAPVFMFVMGMCMQHSRRSGAKDWAIRGLKLLAQAVGLSMVVMAGSLYCGQRFFPSDAGAWAFIRLQDVALHGNILNFAGLSFLTFALMKALGFRAKAMLATVAGAAALQGVLLATCEVPEHPWPLHSVVGWFLGIDPWCYFPLLGWLTYPVAGYLFAGALRSSGHPERLLRRAGLAGLAVFGAGLALSLFAETEGFPLMEAYGGTEDVFYSHHPVLLVRCLGWVFFEIWICELAAGHIPEAVMKPFRRWSGNVCAMYVISWFIILWTSLIFLRGRWDLGIGAWLASSVAVFAATDLGAVLWKRMSRRG